MEQVAEKAKEQKKQNGLLVLACARGYVGDVDQLLDQGADPRAVDKRKVSALQYACGQGRLEVVQRLYRRGVELDIEDTGGNTPVHWAVLGGHTRVVEFLISKGAWVEGYNSYDDTPLHIASRSGNDDIIRLLLGSGGRSSVGDTNRRSLTPLGEALINGRTGSANLLIQEGKSNVTVRAQGLTLLHVVAAADRAASLKLLLNHKHLDVNDGANPDGVTPLHCAALAGSAECAQLMLNARADSSLTTHDGRLPLDLLRKSANADLQNLLQSNKKVQANKAKGTLAPGQAARSNGSASRSAAQASFQTLSEVQQKDKVRQWADLEDGKLQEAVKGLHPAVLEHVRPVRMARQALHIQKGTAEMLEDEDFQRDAGGGHLEKVVDDIKAHPETYERHANDPATMTALAKLKRFHSLAKANGQATVPLEEILRSSQPDWQATCARRLQGLERMAEAHTLACCAAAVADSNHAAAKAASDIVESFKSPTPSTSAPRASIPATTPASKTNSRSASKPPVSKRAPAEPPTSSNTSSSNPLLTPQTSASALASAAQDRGNGSVQGPNGTTPPTRLTRRSRTESGGSAISHRSGGSVSEIEAADLDDLSAWEDKRAQEQKADTDLEKKRWGEVFTWKAFLKEMRRQMLQAIFVCGFAIFLMWAVGLPLPWTTDSSAEVANRPPEKKIYETAYDSGSVQSAQMPSQ